MELRNFFFYEDWYKQSLELLKEEFGEYLQRLFLIEVMVIGTTEAKYYKKDGPAWQDRVMKCILPNIEASVKAQRRRYTMAKNNGGGRPKIQIAYKDLLLQAMYCDCDYKALAEYFGISEARLKRRINPKRLSKLVDIFTDLRDTPLAIRRDLVTGEKYRGHFTESEIVFEMGLPKYLE